MELAFPHDPKRGDRRAAAGGGYTVPGADDFRKISPTPERSAFKGLVYAAEIIGGVILLVGFALSVLWGLPILAIGMGWM